MSDQPKRVQRRRTRGYRQPEGVVYVGRGKGPIGVFGNPFTIADCLAAGFAETEDDARRVVVETFEAWLSGDSWEWAGAFPAERAALLAALPRLHGRDLACWCPPGPCHGDVLLKIANSEGKIQCLTRPERPHSTSSSYRAQTLLDLTRVALRVGRGGS